MSALETRMGDRRAAARNAAERRKKIFLVGLAVVLVAVLAFQLPKLMKRSSSSSSTAATSVTTLATPAAASDASRTLASVSAPAKRMRAIRRLAPKDPFVPLIKDTATTSTPASARSTARTPARAATRVTPLRIVQATAKPAVVKPAHVRPAVPTAAVIRTNGKRQVVGLSQVFSVGDARFRLSAVTRNAIRIKVVGGLFAGGKQSITVRKSHGVKLANTATGVTYQLRFQSATTASPTVIQPSNTTANAAASASAN